MALVTPINNFSMAEVTEIVNRRGKGTMTVSDLKLIFLELQGYDLERIATGEEKVYAADAALWNGRYLNGNATTSDLKEIMSNFLSREELDELFGNSNVNGSLIITTDLLFKTTPLGNDYESGSGSGSGSASGSGSGSGSASSSGSGND